ncbi:hypothetical protein OFN97_00070 [Campylobacter sp. VBCF_05 NA6]|uniref:hypothetical protein n=1 Tax=unclassified Campylobacter TaxID=2593542 RepID=UPI0022E9B76E|nr:MULTISPECIES: hypothetical protein [unclassified Campylobacter]MDA3057516.1 hypothetical protein [Campylobacter sp. VBCF_04 NA7]MDA3058416.1 hypothetical protein [Campylobacter sp. VBCF_05 NA6]
MIDSVVASELFINEDILTFWAGRNKEICDMCVANENFDRIKRYNISLSNLKVDTFRAGHVLFGDVGDIFLKFSAGRIRFYGDKAPRLYQGVCHTKTRIGRKDVEFHFVYASAYDASDNLVEVLHIANDKETMFCLVDIMLNGQDFSVDEYHAPTKIDLDADHTRRVASVDVRNQQWNINAAKTAEKAKNENLDSELMKRSKFEVAGQISTLLEKHKETLKNITNRSGENFYDLYAKFSVYDDFLKIESYKSALGDIQTILNKIYKIKFDRLLD